MSIILWVGHWKVKHSILTNPFEFVLVEEIILYFVCLLYLQCGSMSFTLDVYG